MLVMNDFNGGIENVFILQGFTVFEKLGLRNLLR